MKPAARADERTVAPAVDTSRVSEEERAPRSGRPELPLGGRTIFPRYRLVGFCGTPGAPALGRLLGDLDVKAPKVAAYAAKYAGSRPVLQVYELITVVVQGAPGADGKWRRRVPELVVERYLAAARKAKALLLLNIQPGHSDFLTELRHYERFLREPDVGVALDPEWAMKAKQKPGAYYGQTTGHVVDAVAEYLARIVADGDLPEKALVVHQMNRYVLKDEDAISARPGVAIVKSVDGLGPRGSKVTTYRVLTKGLSTPIHPGFKLFFDEDEQNGAHLMSPEQVLSLSPEPEYVMYE